MRLPLRMSALALLAGWLALALPTGLAAAQTSPLSPAAPISPPSPVTPPTPPSAQAQLHRYPRITEVRLRDLAAIVIVHPENRTDIAVSVINPGPLRMPEVRAGGRRVTIDGKLRRQISSCRGNGERFEANIARVGRLMARQLPTVMIHTPQNVVVSGGGAVRLHVERAEDVFVHLEGCGESDIESVENEADITVSGHMDVRVYEAGEATVRVAGEGDVVLGLVREGLTASLAGEGDLIAARVDGPTNIAIQGEGDVTIRDGRATVLSAVIAGDGDFTHGGSAERLDVVIIGSGDVRVRRVDGEITRRVFGSGDVVVGR